MANNTASSGDYSKPYGDSAPFFVGSTAGSQGGVNSQYAIPDATRKIAAMKQMIAVNYDNASAKGVNDLSPLEKLG